MGKRMAFIGAGAVGGYVGGMLADHGEDVTLIDPWPEHIDFIKKNGIRLGGTQGEVVARPAALHLHEVQGLIRNPVEIAFLCTKSYDTDWAVMLIAQYLAADGFVVSLQNGINEERIAAIVGWGRVVGCIASTIGVDAVAPGHVLRMLQPGGAAYTVFRVGEIHGRRTKRVEALAETLRVVDSARVTENLWGERWSKLTQNAMGNGISACTGLSGKEVLAWETSRRLSIRLAGEAIRVGRALGYELEPIRGVPPQSWVAAGEGDPAALAAVEGAIAAAMARMGEEGRPSTAQDMLKGRRTEIEFINGLVARKGIETGIPAPTHAALTELVKRVERGEIAADPRNIDTL